MASLADYATDEGTARVILSMIAEPANVTVGRLLRQEGGIETLRALETTDPISGARPEEAAILHNRVQEVISRPDFDDALRDALDGSYQPLIPGDPHWPAPVDDLGDRAPYVLWTRGATSFLAGSSHDRLTITGARASTSYGNQAASELAQGASLAELIVVSGGAYGIDGAAHRAALSVGGSTIAVMAGGPDHLYPRGHADMLEQIADTGLLVSELPPRSTPTRQRFAARGRLLAALSSSTVIVEAGARSGALDVAREARALGRGVGAVPGPATSATSTGTHMLIREGTATLITGPHDLLTPMNTPPAAGLSRSHGLESGPQFDELDADRYSPGRGF